MDVLARCTTPSSSIGRWRSTPIWSHQHPQPQDARVDIGTTEALRRACRPTGARRRKRAPLPCRSVRMAAVGAKVCLVGEALYREAGRHRATRRLPPRRPSMSDLTHIDAAASRHGGCRRQPERCGPRLRGADHYCRWRPRAHRRGGIKKGDVLTIAQHAGIMAASALPTSSRLPPLALTAVNVELEPERDGPPGRDPHHRHLSASAANRCRDED